MRAAYGVGGPRPDYIDTSACVGCKACEAQAMKFVSSRICTYSRRSSRRGSRPGISPPDPAGHSPASEPRGYVENLGRRLAAHERENRSVYFPVAASHLTEDEWAILEEARPSSVRRHAATGKRSEED